MDPRIVYLASIRAESRAPVALSHHLTEPNRLTGKSALSLYLRARCHKGDLPVRSVRAVRRAR